ncbi:MAG: inositol monophosphatase [Desulfuromonas sp.]|nr:MAG: inositol monophosphatase [Desulfuromonas sp.]
MRVIAIQAAQAGGEVLMQHFGRLTQIEEKHLGGLVTEADRNSEQTIVEAIRSTFPRHDVLAEENTYAAEGSPYKWIIDPLDGTTNFAHSFPWFAISIALEVEGELVLGVIYNPVSGEMFVAEKGQGAFLNDQPIKVSTVDSLEQSLLATGFPYDRKISEVNNYDHFITFQQAAQACRRPGAAALDLACVAAGRFDGYWEMKLKPWDVAAGKLLVEEAGGTVTDFKGTPCDIYGTETLASNGQIHDTMLELLSRGATATSAE